MSRSQARTDAFYRLGETCPKVKTAMREALMGVLVGDSRLAGEVDSQAMAYELADTAMDAAVTYGTNPLRNALIECEEERLTTARERDDLTEEVDRLKRELESAERALDEANRRADAAEAQIP